jgi:hypothetical protein
LSAGQICLLAAWLFGAFCGGAFGFSGGLLLGSGFLVELAGSIEMLLWGGMHERIKGVAIAQKIS